MVGWLRAAETPQRRERRVCRDTSGNFCAFSTCSAVLIGIPICVLILNAAACALERQPVPTVAPTQTSTAPYSGEIEGLVLPDNGRFIIGVNWLSRSRITYRVKGGNVEAVEKLLGETVRVTGEIIDYSPWLKEIVVQVVEASSAPDRLCMRIGYIKELGPSIYMQGTHTLVDREGKLICLLEARGEWLKLDQYIGSEVAVVGVMSKTVEGNAQIMDVKLIEPVK